MSVAGKIRLTGKNRSFRPGSARDLWWQEIQKWEGKSVQDWLDAMSASPPSKPGIGKYEDSGEPPSGWISWFERQGLVVVEEGTSSGGWTDIELEAAIEVYDEMLQKLDAGESIVKARYYEHLVEKHGRTTGAFEYRMQNISSVLADMGIDWISGLPPAKNVGANVIKRITRIIRDGEYFEGRIRAPIMDPDKLNRRANEIRSRGVKGKPKGNKNPKRAARSTDQIERDPDVVAWVLDAANDTCECCVSAAPFIRSKDETGYLEVHHVNMLGNGGSDTIENAVALCPNCHRELHYGENSAELIHQLYEQVSRLVPE